MAKQSKPSPFTTMQVKCPKCQVTTAVPLAATAYKCPNCGADLTIPESARLAGQKKARTAAIITVVIAGAVVFFVWHAISHPSYPITVTPTGRNQYTATLKNDTGSVHDTLCSITGYNVGGGLMGTDVHETMLQPHQTTTWTGTLDGTGPLDHVQTICT